MFASQFPSRRKGVAALPSSRTPYGPVRQDSYSSRISNSPKGGAEPLEILVLVYSIELTPYCLELIQ